MSYLENSKVALQALNEIYYVKGTFKGTMFWDRAEFIELIEDACEKLGDEHKTQLQEMIDTSIKISTEDWSRNPYYDDILWMCIAFARAGVILDKPHYIDLAKNNLDYVTKNGIINYGLVDHMKGKGWGCTISSVTYAVASALIGKIIKDTFYLDQAKAMLDTFMQKLYNPDNGHVYDHITAEGKIEYFEHVSNAGMFIRACSEIYEYTKDEKYLVELDKAASYIIDKKYNNSIMCEHEFGDGAGFKAILTRQLGYVANKHNLTDYINWMQCSAESAWNNRNKYNLMQNDFCTKTADHRLYRAFDCQSAVTLLISCI